MRASNAESVQEAHRACPSCKAPGIQTKDSRAAGTVPGWVRRRKMCPSCKHRWTTVEVPTEDIRVMSQMIRANLEAQLHAAVTRIMNTSTEEEEDDEDEGQDHRVQAQ